MRNYSFWLKAAIISQGMTGIFHVLGIISGSKPNNDTEKTLLDLMQNYKFDLGSGFLHSMDDIKLAFSISFALLLFFSAALNFYLLKTNIAPNIVKGVIVINLLTYIPCFITMVMFTFLPPIVCTGLITLFLMIALLQIRKV